MALNKEQLEEIEKVYQTNLEQEYRRGLKDGFLTFAKLVYANVKENTMPLEDRVELLRNKYKIGREYDNSESLG